MSWRIATEHRSAYHYGEPVTTSYNETRITPCSTRGQRLVESSLVVQPVAPLFSYYDYWSTRVIGFDVQEPHTDLVVTARSVVETANASSWGYGMTWDDLAESDLRDRFSEFLSPTAYTNSDEELDETARELALSSTPFECLDGIGEWIRSNMRYVTGSTRVSTSTLEAWHQRAGVCQDFAHVSLTLLRLMGIPSRYVSGYLHPDADASIGTLTEGQSHAWIEAWFGSWVAMDPTNGAPVGDRHVTVARGRDYNDVAPFRGVYHGGALDHLEVSVALTRLA